LTAEITPVLHERAFFAIPSLSIMTICQLCVSHPHTLSLGNIDAHTHLPGGRCLRDRQPLWISGSG
jgi:hypothetical protein